MIKTKDDLIYYLKCDKAALKIPEFRKLPRPIYDDLWKYEIILRITEFYKNKKSLFSKFFYIIFRTWLEILGQKLSVQIHPNCFGPGLSIAHYGGIIVNVNAKIGKNCRIHEGVTIGATNGDSKAPTIGDNCFLGSGAKIIGNINLGNEIAVGAGAVVIKSFNEDHITLAGIPAFIVSKNGSGNNIIRATDIIDNVNK